MLIENYDWYTWYQNPLIIWFNNLDQILIGFKFIKTFGCKFSYKNHINGGTNTSWIEMSTVLRVNIYLFASWKTRAYD